MPEGKELRIGLFGIAGAGKSAYLSMLIHELRKKQDEFLIEFDSSVIEQYMDECIKQLTERHMFPHPTSYRKEGRISFKISSNNHPKSLRLNILDLPMELVYELFIPGTDGVAFEDPFLRRSHRYRQYVDMIDDFIDYNTAFFFLINPAPEKASVQDAMISNIIRAISKRKSTNGCENLKLPIAFCMTMWDEYEESISDKEVYANKILRISMKRYAQRLPVFKLFTCSAVGEVELIEDEGETIRKPKDTISPKNVIEPITWFYKISSEKPRGKKKKKKKKTKTTRKKRKTKERQTKKKEKKQKVIDDEVKEEAETVEVEVREKGDVISETEEIAEEEEETLAEEVKVTDKEAEEKKVDEKEEVKVELEKKVEEDSAAEKKVVIEVREID